jgi:hypothetical protein
MTSTSAVTATANAATSPLATDTRARTFFPDKVYTDEVFHKYSGTRRAAARLENA